MANILWGFGGVYIVYGGLIADLPFANGSTRFVPESNTRTAKSGRDIINYVGYRPIITVNLINISETEAREVAKMFSILNSAQSNGITVYPRYDATATTNLSYLCRCISEIAPEDIADSPVGQDITLQFRGILRVTTIPSNITNTNLFNIVETIGGIEHNITETISL